MVGVDGGVTSKPMMIEALILSSLDPCKYQEEMIHKRWKRCLRMRSQREKRVPRWKKFKGTIKCKGPRCLVRKVVNWLMVMLTEVGRNARKVSSMDTCVFP